ncbi:MAG: hypothetical protein KM310_08395 [Clostridiales bacterium]|nr:hypothetical protein [Clostridiales bacterium]
MGSDRPLSQKEIDLLLQQIAGAQAKSGAAEKADQGTPQEAPSAPSRELTPEERAWLLKVEVDVTVSLGGTAMPLKDVLSLKPRLLPIYEGTSAIQRHIVLREMRKRYRV